MNIEWKSIKTTLPGFKFYHQELYITKFRATIYTFSLLCDNKKEKQQMNFY